MKSGKSELQADLAFRAFSDRTRLRILHLLLGGELCVGDLVSIIRIPQPTASRHLNYLRRAALVTTRRQGAWIFYSLAPSKRTLHKKMLECLSHCFNEVSEIRADDERARKLRKAGGCCPPK
jgi:ArsR family transcriptional regulator